MKALIFGGTRFMGKYVSREFLESGYEVTIANRGTNQPEPGVKTLKIDRSVAGAVDVLKGSKFDVVIDFSAYPSAWVKEAGEVLKGNIGRYLFISSGAVYKKSNYFPLQEHYERAPNELFFTYSDEKIKGENFLLDFSSKGYFETVSCRLPYVMGIDNYEDREGFVLSRIINDRPVLVPNGGESVKSFIYAGDVAKALMALTRTGSHVDGEAFNIAIPEGITGMGFVRICSEIVGKEAKVHFVDPSHPKLQQEGFNLRDMLFPFPDSTGYLDYRKLQNYTGFVPRCSLKDAITEFYEDMIARGDTKPRRYDLEDRALALLNLKV